MYIIQQKKNTIYSGKLRKELGVMKPKGMNVKVHMAMNIIFRTSNASLPSENCKINLQTLAVLQIHRQAEGRKCSHTAKSWIFMLQPSKV